MLNADPKRPINRAGFIIVGVIVVGFGLNALRGGPLYQGWGGKFFAPYTILIGVVFILTAIFKLNIFKW